MLVGFGQALDLGKPGVQAHGWVVRVLGEVQVGCPPQLLLNHQSLLKQLKNGNVY
jgi:hypothetical protein